MSYSAVTRIEQPPPREPGSQPILCKLLRIQQTKQKNELFGTCTTDIAKLLNSDICLATYTDIN